MKGWPSAGLQWVIAMSMKLLLTGCAMAFAIAAEAQAETAAPDLAELSITPRR